MLSINFQKYSNKTYLPYIGENICNLHTALINIKNRYLLSKENKTNCNFSFTVLYKNNIKNLISQVYSYNTTNNLFSMNHNLNSTSTDFTEDQILINKNEEIPSKDGINIYSENQVLQNCNNSTIILEEEDISHEIAYNLLLDLLKNKVELVEEVLSIANILIEEGVLVAPESKIKKNISKIIPYIQKQKTQNLDHSR